MKIAVPCESADGMSRIAARFARAPFYWISERAGQGGEFVANPFANASQGVGAGVVGMLTGQGVNLLVAHELGLKVQQFASQKELGLLLLPEWIVSIDQVELLFTGKKI